MRDIDVLWRFGTLNPVKLAESPLPPGTCSGCGKVPWRGETNKPGSRESRNYRLTNKAVWGMRNGAR